MKFVYIFGAIFFIVYSQIIIKWELLKGDLVTSNFDNIFSFYFATLINPYIASGIISAFVSSLFWIKVLSEVDLSYAYPFMSIAFIIVGILSFYLFNEQMTVNKLVGTLLVVVGIIVVSRG